MKKISAGNFKDIVKKRNNAWVVGHFMKTGTPFCIADFEIKWAHHQKGESRDTAASNDQSKSLCILISGKVSLKFPDYNKNIVLQNQGDYIFWDKGVFHTWSVLKDSLVLTIRWPSLA